jgi:hypothetical protein
MLLNWCVTMAILSSGPTVDALQAPQPICQELARRVRETLEKTPYLSFEASVEQGGIKPGGEAAPFQEIIRARVWMRAERVRTEVFRSGDAKPVVTLVDDGQRFLQWSPTEWAEQASATHAKDPLAGRDQQVGRSLVDGCLFGAWMITWLGDCTPYPARFSERIGEGQYLGIDAVDGHPCHVVFRELAPRQLSPSESLRVRKCYYIDVQSGLLRRRKTSQVIHDVHDRIRQDMTRIETMRNLRTDPFTDDVFKGEPPAAARQIHIPAKAEEPAQEE